MRTLVSTVVNWIAALFAATGGAPHPIVATDPKGGSKAKPEPRPGVASRAKLRRHR